MYRLSPRLQALAQLVPKNACVADVGADHGYLSIYLMESAIAERVVASDIRPGPLSSARRNVLEAGLENQIDLRLCDGLADVLPHEVDTIIIAGMGGETIAGILERASWALQDGRLLLLQPQSKQAQLRQWLYDQGCGIQKEFLVEDGGKIYPYFSAGGNAVRQLSYGELVIGHWPEESRTDLFYRYLEKEINRLLYKLDGLNQSDSEENRSIVCMLRNTIDELCSMRKQVE